MHRKHNNGADIGNANGNRLYVEPAGNFCEIGISRFNGNLWT
ncbi:MAG TPA: hypothetical protein VFE62_12635 [Gemmataceae bacterium]|nr:hypothetical protein [Gemmataceae bacterium]